SSSRQLATDQPDSFNDLAPVRSARLRAFLWLLVVSVLTVVVCSPFVRFVWLLSDEGIFLRGAELMLAGKRLYADFFEFLPPGNFLIIEGWFRLTGVSLLSARILAIGTIVGIACFT